MSGRVPGIAQLIQEEIRAILPRELRECALLQDHVPALPPPNDMEAEEVVLGGLLSIEFGLGELGDLEAHHFFLPLHRWLFTKLQLCVGAGLAPTTQLLVAAATEEGISPDGIKPEIENLAWQPWCSPDHARSCAERIRTAFDARQLVDRLAREVVALRSGVLTPTQTRERLRRIGEE